ncbi:flavin reductase family protein [Clostridiaceae bacterium M8S5]|nr:flavin reductase family protein [Clostridiaceae bacterium M8S5]
MIKNISYNDYSDQMLGQLVKGAFMTTKYGDIINTMTIGWGTIGFMWRRPIYTVAVRLSRYTYDLIEKSKEFTVSVPLKSNMKRELLICGTKSGRDVDKLQECNLSAQKGQYLETPIIGECDLHYECKVVHQQILEPALLEKDIIETNYKNNDIHVMYYGEIVASYINE